MHQQLSLKYASFLSKHSLGSYGRTVPQGVRYYTRLPDYLTQGDRGSSSCERTIETGGFLVDSDCEKNLGRILRGDVAITEESKTSARYQMLL